MSARYRPRRMVLSLVLTLSAALSSALAACTTPAATPVASTPPTPVPTQQPSPSPVADFPITLTDDEGTTVEIAARPLRIVSLTPAATEILFAIGAGDRVVAKVEDIFAFPPEANDLPVVATYQGVDVEKIVALDADLVIADTLNPPDSITQLRGLDIPVVVLGAKTVDAALNGIELVGQATGSPEVARDLAASMRAQLDQLTAATADLPKPRVFYEIGAGDTIYTIPDGSVYAEMLRSAGADPVTTDSSYVISLEQLIAADPEIILLGDGTAVADVATRPRWEGIAAVKDGNIHVVDDTVVTRPGPRLVDGLRALIGAIHPDVVLPSALPIVP